MPRRGKLLQDLKQGACLTASQIVTRYGYASEGSVRKILSELRFKGQPVNRVYSGRLRRARYRFGRPTRAQVGFGHALMNEIGDPSRISIERR